MHCVTGGRNCSSSSFFLKKLLCLYAKVLWLGSFLIFIVDELKNFAANNLLQVDELVTY